MRSGERKNSSCPPSERLDSCSPLKEESGKTEGGERKQVKEGEKRSRQRGPGRCGGFALSSRALLFEPSWLDLEGITTVALRLSSPGILTNA